MNKPPIQRNKRADAQKNKRRKNMEHLNLFLLQHARKKRKFTVKFVSRIIGITASTLCHWETGKTPIPAEKLLQLCHLYGCSVNDLINKEA